MSFFFFFFSSRRRHTRCSRDWSSDVCSSDLDFVKKDDGIQMTSHLLGELAAFFIANVAWRRANQPRDTVLLHVLAHVDADHQLLVVEKKFRQSTRSEEHTSELQSRLHLVCRLLLEKKKKHTCRHTLSHITG